ncbi:site-specific integrase [Bacillus sp. JJ1122]|uniref:tyrosine-type recombinase/integrase n=1 Tax=Bacillus sp. JJ1122 TaxID=3122951 RepID=UPI003000F552
MKGSVKKEGNSWYYVFYLEKDLQGKRKQKKKRGFKTKKEAQIALAETINSVNKGTYLEPSNTLYKDFLEQWYSVKQSSIGIQTAKVYKQYIYSRIIPALGNISLSKINTMQVQFFVNSLNDEGLSSATVKKAIEIVRNSLEYALDFEFINKNPATKVKLPKRNKKEMIVWNEDEVNQFFRTGKDDPLFIVFFLALMTGMRQGEILGLRWQDIDLEKGLLRIKQTLSHDGKTFISGAKTQSSLRTINLSYQTLNILKKTRNSIAKIKLSMGSIYQDYDLVACCQHGTPLNPANVRRTFKKLIKLAGLPDIRFHDLRHTHATLLLSQGVNVKVISERLGHSNIKVTLDTYSHVLPTMQEEVVRKLDQLIK